MIRNGSYWLDAGPAGVCRVVVLEVLDGPGERVRVLLPATSAELVVPCSLLCKDHPLRTQEMRRGRALPPPGRRRTPTRTRPAR